MKIMKNDHDISDMQLIIKNLIAFIAVEGKQYIDDAKIEAYVDSYVSCLIQTIHLIDQEKEDLVIKTIVDDIATYLK